MLIVWFGERDIVSFRPPPLLQLLMIFIEYADTDIGFGDIVRGCSMSRVPIKQDRMMKKGKDQRRWEGKGKGKGKGKGNGNGNGNGYRSGNRSGNGTRSGTHCGLLMASRYATFNSQLNRL